MKLYYLNKTLIHIPFTIIRFNSNINNNITFKLNNNNINKDLLWNVNNINDIKVNININNIIVINDYIYKYQLSNNNNIYNLSKSKIVINSFSKYLNSIWFINNL